jgi:hypothetical protein
MNRSCAGQLADDALVGAAAVSARQWTNDVALKALPSSVSTPSERSLPSFLRDRQGFPRPQSRRQTLAAMATAKATAKDAKSAKERRELETADERR